MKVAIDSEAFDLLIRIFAYASAARSSISGQARAHAMQRMFDAVDAYGAYVVAKRREARRDVA